MNVLVIAPHPDDETIGCGGTLCRHSDQNDVISAVFLTSGELGLKSLPRAQAWAVREAEAHAAAKVIGIQRLDFLHCPDWTMAENLEAVADMLSPSVVARAPDLIYLPHPNEWHPDHRATFPALSLALARSGVGRPKMRGYEVWTPMMEFQHCENITAYMARKLDALAQHASQLVEWDYARAACGLNQFRGAMAGRCDYAEVFQDLTLP